MKPQVEYLKGRYRGVYRVTGRTGTSFGIDLTDRQGRRIRRVVGKDLGHEGAVECLSNDWLMYDEYWPDPDSVLDRIVKVVEGLGIPHIEKPFPRITSLPLGHRFRVRVVNDVQVGGGQALHCSFVTEVLGLAEPALAR